MINNVLRLSDYRQPLQSAADPPRDLEELAAMSYDAAVDWAGADFQRLAAVARARDYRPEWIAHQLENHGKQLSAQQAEILARMVAKAGPYISRRQRWIMRQLRVKALTEKALAVMAALAVEYCKYKDVPHGPIFKKVPDGQAIHRKFLLLNDFFVCKHAGLGGLYRIVLVMDGGGGRGRLRRHYATVPTPSPANTGYGYPHSEVTRHTHSRMGSAPRQHAHPGPPFFSTPLEGIGAQGPAMA